MKITTEIKKYIDKSVLCWLATSSNENMPNVSPKEIFSHYKDDTIIVANIASPQTVKNINQNKNVCLSFIDVLIQKGYQLKGTASIVKKGDISFPEMEKILTKMTGGNFPFASIIVITVHQTKPIIAPKYVLYHNTTEEEQIASAKKTYQL